MNEDWLPEQLKTISNLCKVAQILINVGHGELLPTVLELLFEQAQELTLDHCVKGE